LAARDGRLRVGVIGLGRLWEARHKPAFARLAGRVEVRAVYDQVARRAAIEAAQLGCEAAEGLTELVDRPDVDAIYLLTPQWFGLHPIDLACARGKPIYCALPVAGDPEALAEVAPVIAAGGTPFVPELARRLYPATVRLRELLATALGPPRLVLGFSRLQGFDRYGQPGPTTQIAPAPLAVDPGSYLLDWCRFVVGKEPVSVHGVAARLLPAGEGDGNGDDDDPGPESDFEGFTLTFDGGEVAQVAFGRYHRGAWGDATRFLPAPGFQVFAERGAAWVEMPDRVQWTDARGAHDERLPMDPTVGEALNDQFHRHVRDAAAAPTLADALATARLVAALRRSCAEGRAVDPRQEANSP
jgi:predicted dehydrogenase